MAAAFSKLDRVAIRKLPVGDKITERGITAEKLPDGDVRFSVNIMVDGQRIHRVIGRESESVTRTQAEEFVAQARTEARHNRLSLPKGRKLHASFGDAADDYLKRLEESGGKNLKAKRSQMTAHLRPFFAAKRLDQVLAFDIERYKKERRDAGATNGTINRELATLSHFLNRAVDWKWIAAKPVRIVKLAEDGRRLVALTDEQCDALLRTAVADADPYCWLFVMFGLNTAMRHSEILRARFEHLDLHHKRLFVPQAKAGTREQPITQELADALKKEKETAKEENAGWIFPTPRPTASESGHRDRMDKPFRRAVISAGLAPETVTPHTMRHTAITKLVKAGVDIPTIQRISGHKTTAMVMRYTHVHGEHIDRAMEALGRKLPEPDANKSADAATPKLHIALKRAS